jgi:hypothetical protein
MTNDDLLDAVTLDMSCSRAVTAQRYDVLNSSGATGATTVSLVCAVTSGGPPAEATILNSYVQGPGGVATIALDQVNVGVRSSRIAPLGAFGETSASHAGTWVAAVGGDRITFPRSSSANPMKKRVAPEGSGLVS